MSDSVRMRIKAAAAFVGVPERSLFRAVRAGTVPSMPDENGVATLKCADVQAWAASRKRAGKVPARDSACVSSQSAPNGVGAGVATLPVAAPETTVVPDEESKPQTDAGSAPAAVAISDVERAVPPPLAPPASSTPDPSSPKDPLVQELAVQFARLEEIVVTLSSTVTSTGREVEHAGAENRELAIRMLALEQAVATLRSDFIALNQLVAFLLSSR